MEGGIMERGIMEEASGGGILGPDHCWESLLWIPGCGILAVESWLWNHCCGILTVESWMWNPGFGSIWRHLGSI